MSTRRSSGFLAALGVMVLAALTGCTPAESRDNPEGEPIAAEEPAEQQMSAEESPASPESAPPASAAATRSPAPEPEAAAVAVPSGTRMTFRLDESLSTKSTRTGDTFETTLTHDVVSPQGDLLIPMGARARGLVVEAQESQGSDELAVLALRLESVTVDGESHPLKATIVEADASNETRDSGGETAAKVAVGTAAGALLGRIIGRDTKGALIGAGAGAVAGTVFAVSTQDGHAEMHEGSMVTVVLDEPLVVTR